MDWFATRSLVAQAIGCAPLGGVRWPSSGGARGRRLALVAALLSALTATGAVEATDAAGYFGGLRIDGTSQALTFSAPGLKLGQRLEFGRAEAWPLARSTAFGGYQFDSGLAIGAAVSTAHGRLQPESRSLGLQIDPARWAAATRGGQQVSLDVVSAFNWRSAVSVYGRLGVGRGDLRWVDPMVPNGGGVDRTSASYGVGVRYDFSPSLGLKLEMSRGVRSPWERIRVEPEGDSINFGIRWVF